MGLDVVIVMLALAGVGLIFLLVRVLRIRQRERRDYKRTLPMLVYQARRGEARRSFDAPEEQITYNSAAAPADSPVRLVSEPVEPPTGRRPAEPDAEATLQLLPGRLEPVGRDGGEEIRFVRLPGITRFTLGRSPATEPGHIQLQAATASRMHAYMVYRDGRWHMGNMSATNHVMLNGAALNDDAARPLHDGDRIEFGELTFVFRER